MIKKTYLIIAAFVIAALGVLTWYQISISEKEKHLNMLELEMRKERAIVAQERADIEASEKAEKEIHKRNSQRLDSLLSEDERKNGIVRDLYSESKGKSKVEAERKKATTDPPNVKKDLAQDSQAKNDPASVTKSDKGKAPAQTCFKGKASLVKNGSVYTISFTKSYQLDLHRGGEKLNLAAGDRIENAIIHKGFLTQGELVRADGSRSLIKGVNESIK